MKKKLEILNDEEIRITIAEAQRLSWTHKAHPSYEKEKYLLEAQRDKDWKAMAEYLTNLTREYCPNLETGKCIMKVWLPLEDWLG